MTNRRRVSSFVLDSSFRFRHSDLRGSSNRPPITPHQPRAQTEGPPSDSRRHRVGLALYRTDVFGNLAPGLGPPRSAQPGGSFGASLSDRRLIATVPPRPLTQQGGKAVS